MIRRVKIRGYKSLADVEVNLKPLSVLFGPNAAGKSNFLDALQLLSKITTSRTLKEAFEPPYRGTPLESFAFGTDGIPGLLAQESASFSIEIDVDLSPVVIDAVSRQIREMKKIRTEREPADSNGKGHSRVTEKRLRYRIEIEILPKTGILRVTDEYLAALNSKGEVTGKRRPFLGREGERLRLRLEGQAHPRDYERYLDYSILSMPHYPPHYPHLVAMREELKRWLFFYFEPRERMRAPNPVKEVRHIGMMGEELASFLNTLRALDNEQFKAVEKSLRMIIPSVTGIDVEINNLGEVELRLKEGAMPVPARVLSEGTLRVLGLLALSGAKEPPTLLGFEEPENGIHPHRIRMIAGMLKTRAAVGTQLIVTTHSPTLLDLIPTDGLFVCRRLNGCTVIESFKSEPLWHDNEISKALNIEEDIPISQRLLRGDFDA
jgi:predicted ATPase